MSEIDTSQFTLRRASDYPADARFITPDGDVVRPDADGCWVIVATGEHTSGEDQVAEYKPTEPEPVTPEQPKSDADVLREARELIDSQAVQLRALKIENDRLTNSVETKSRQLQDVRTQVENIREHIIEEAKNRGWCDEVNTFLRRCDLDEWETEYEVHFASFTVTLTVAGCIDGDSEEVREQAHQEVLNDPSAYLEADYVEEA